MTSTVRLALRDRRIGGLALVLSLLFGSLVAVPAHAADKICLRGRPLPAHAGRHEESLRPVLPASRKGDGPGLRPRSSRTDWAGIATALANGQADVAWMGPWGYVLANKEGDAQAIATVKYDGKPFYHAIIVGRPDLKIGIWPDDAKGLSISFADRGSTSGWLVPTYWFKTKGIDPKSFFKYREGASHPANETAVANGQVDLATDYDRNLNSMIERNLIPKDACEGGLDLRSSPQ